jgi:hypothetical protein
MKARGKETTLVEWLKVKVSWPILMKTLIEVLLSMERETVMASSLIGKNGIIGQETG